MSNSKEIFAGDDPFAITRAWLAEAEQTEPNDPNAIALASVDPDGLPNVRMVLLKDIEDDGFVFYTNYESKKASELDANAQTAFVMHWKSLRRQIRVRGTVTREDGPKAGRILQLPLAQKQAGGMGVQTVSALEFARRVDCGSGQDHRAQRDQSGAATLLGRVSDKPG